jgi:hypothetical protein
MSQSGEPRRDSGVVASPYDQPGFHGSLESVKAGRRKSKDRKNSGGGLRKVSLGREATIDGIGSINDLTTSMDELAQRPSITSIRAKSMSPTRGGNLRSRSQTRSPLDSQELLERDGGRHMRVDLQRSQDNLAFDGRSSRKKSMSHLNSTDSLSNPYASSRDIAAIDSANRAMPPKSIKSPKKRKSLTRSEGPVYGSLDEMPVAPQIPPFNMESAKRQIIQVSRIILLRP